MPVAVDRVDLERELVRLPEVLAARLVTDTHGQPVQARVRCTTQTVSDEVRQEVAALVLARSGTRLEPAAISVEAPGQARVAGPDTTAGANGSGAGLADPSPGGPPPVPPDQSGAGPSGDPLAGTGPHGQPGARTRLELVSSTTDGRRCRLEVWLGRSGRRAIGVVEGSASASLGARLAADATLSALAQLQPVAADAAVQGAAVIALGQHRLAVVSLVLVTDTAEVVMSGSALLGPGGEHDAVARAVLDATNRRLAHLEAGPLEATGPLEGAGPSAP